MIHTLKAHFPQCFDKNGDLMPHKLQEAILDLAQESTTQHHAEQKDNANITAQSDIAQDLQEKDAILSLSKETYTLNWLGKSYAKLLRHLPTNTLIAQDLAHNAQAEHKNSKNVLIKGDNLEVLKHLKNAYYNKIKMIYIDPPYNTGNDGFIYNDERNFTPQSLAQMANIEIDEANKILNYTLKNSSTHSAWLSFMYPRLYIARGLLRDDGVIFISIDDNEQANLKILCDEIFGEENFLAQIVWKQFHSVKNDANNFSKNTEYILCYSKNVIKDIIHNEIFDKSDSYKLDDKDGKGFYKLDPVWAKSGTNAETYIFKNGKSWRPPSGTFWRYSIETLKRMEMENEIVFNGKNPMAKRYLNKVSEGRKSSTFWDGKEVGYTLNGDAEVKNIFDDNKIFKNPKPTTLIKRMLEISTTPHTTQIGKGNDSPHSLDSGESDIILDFFAGSGTTAHAVMELNAEDNGNRQFILVQLDEKIDPTKASGANKATIEVAYKFCKNELGSENPTIFDITKERIKRVSAKIAQSPNAHANLDLGFKVYEIRQNNLKSDNDSLFDSINLSDDDKNALLESFKLQDSLLLSMQNFKVDLGGYEGILAGKKLYLLNPHFETKHLQNLIEKIDTQKDFVIKEISYLNNVFNSARIREIEEGIASYTNKKGLKILVRARFI